MPPTPGRFVDIGGFKLHLQSTGTGTPVVVFDAALGATSISWLHVQPAVAAFARTCAYDRAGLGWSDAGPMPRTAGRAAEELRTLLDRAGEPPPYLLVGHSFGGLVMRIFAARWPAETAGLVLVDPAHPEDWLRPAPKEQVLIDRGVELCRLGARASKVGVSRAVAALAGMGALAPAWALTSWFTKGKISARDNQILAPMWKLPPDARKPLRHFWTRVAFYQALGSHIETISMSAAETLTASAGGYGDLPLVTISSTDPGSYRLAQQEALAKLSTRGRHFVATRSSHWIPLDQPDLIVAVVRGLVASVRIA